jgi:large subunit ribosomal protein L19
VGVERIFPIHSPNIEKIEIVKATPSRKAKIYFVREGKVARVKDATK